ncbi:hypothetical protein BDV3_005325 [Batrachochytrium dendrobatidis]|nr:hypothetical protein QVD99_006265 [Batrachochytrium dendrobatidis]
MLSNHIILIQLLIVLWTVPTVVLSSPVPAQDQVFQYKLLKDVRANQWLTFVPLNHKQREDLLTRVESMLMVSPNIESKIEYYGTEANPFPSIKNLRSQLNTISDTELQLQITDIINRVKDCHVRYFKPGPYGCINAMTGLKFRYVDADTSSSADFKVVVISATTDSNLLALLGNQFSKIAFGDELLGVDGETFDDWYTNNESNFPSASSISNTRHVALDYLSKVLGSVSRLPEKDSITLTFKNKSGDIYTNTIPYIAEYSTLCWESSSQVYHEVTKSKLAGSQTVDVHPDMVETKKIERQQLFQKAVTLLKEEEEQDIKQRYNVPFEWHKTDINNIMWGIWAPKTKNLGLIRIPSFALQDEIDAKTISIAALKILRKLMVNELKDTTSIVIDVRGNNGGSVLLERVLPQLFMPDYKPIRGQGVANKVTNAIMRGSLSSTLQRHSSQKSTSKLDDESDYKPIYVPNDFELLSGPQVTVGQAYVRPVGIFSDGRCTSACESLLADFQDLYGDVIFGEDIQSAGAGATSFHISTEIETELPKMFPPIPYRQELFYFSGKAITEPMTGVYRHDIRVGVHDGQKIEDIGVKTNYVIRPRLEDLVPYNGNYPSEHHQFDSISDLLYGFGIETGRFDLHFIAEPFTLVVPVGNFDIVAETQGMDEFIVASEHGKTIAHVKNVPTKRGEFRIPCSPVQPGISEGRIIISGLKKGKVLMRTIREVKHQPTLPSYIHLSIDTPQFKLQNKNAGTGIKHAGKSTDIQGWNYHSGGWRFGNGVSFSENADSSILMFFTAPSVGQRVKVSFEVYVSNAAYIKELNIYIRHALDGDFIGFPTDHLDQQESIITVDGGTTQLLRTFSFMAPAKEFTIEIPFQAYAFKGNCQGSIFIKDFTVSLE